MLTKAQERFVQEVVAGKTQRQAYYVAYPRSLKWKVENVDSHASRLFNSGKAKARYEELIERHKKKAIMKRGDLLKGLKLAFEMALGIKPTPTAIKNVIEGITSVEELSLKHADLKAVAPIAEKIAKLEGWLTDKVQMDVTANVQIVDDIDD